MGVRILFKGLIIFLSIIPIFASFMNIIFLSKFTPLKCFTFLLNYIPLLLINIFLENTIDELAKKLKGIKVNAELFEGDVSFLLVTL